VWIGQPSRGFDYRKPVITTASRVMLARATIADLPSGVKSQKYARRVAFQEKSSNEGGRVANAPFRAFDDLPTMPACQKGVREEHYERHNASQRMALHGVVRGIDLPG
jgi:hypothetical protein